MDRIEATGLSDLPALRELSQAIGWRHTDDDWRTILSVGRCSPRADDGRFASSGAVFEYGRTLGFVEVERVCRLITATPVRGPEAALAVVGSLAAGATGEIRLEIPTRQRALLDAFARSAQKARTTRRSWSMAPRRCRGVARRSLRSRAVASARTSRAGRQPCVRCRARRRAALRGPHAPSTAACNRAPAESR